MKQSRQIQIALLASILSIALCVTVLVGTTLAWFVDTSASTGNTVKIGQIDAAFLLQWDETSSETLSPGETQVAALKTTQWAPGKEETVTFQVQKKEASLPFTYSVWLKSDTPEAKLATYLDVYVNDSENPVGTVAELINTPIGMNTLSEDSQENSPTIKLTIRMKAAPLSLAGGTESLDLWFEVRADQVREAVPQPDTLREQLAAGGYVQLGNDLQIASSAPDGVREEDVVPQIPVTQDAMLDLSGKTLGISVDAGTSLPYTPTLLSVMHGSTLTLDGDGTVSAEAGANNSYAINVVEDSTLIINGGTYLGSMSAVQVEKGKAIINGGFFDLAPTCKKMAPDMVGYLINCINEAYNSGEASVEIRGGTFVNFDPSDNPEGEGTSYVAEGYKVNKELQQSGEIWYTVVPEETAENNG